MATYTNTKVYSIHVSKKDSSDSFNYKTLYVRADSYGEAEHKFVTKYPNANEWTITSINNDDEHWLDY